MTKFVRTTQTNNEYQRVVNYYQKLKKRNKKFTLLLMVLIVTALIFLGLFFLSTHKFQEKKNVYEQQINKLKEERSAILSGKTDVNTQSFDDILQNNLSGLKEFSTEENTYEVPIKETKSVLKINQNNIFVSDNAGIISGETKRLIYDLNRQLSASTNGSQLMVVTVFQLPNGEDIESFANKIFNQLGIGSKKENNGVLYVIALNDRKFRLEVGYGLEGVIPDALAADIINNDQVVKNFKNKQYNEAVNQVVEQVFQLMNTKTALVDSKIQHVTDQQQNLLLIYWISLVMPIVLLFITMLFLINIMKASKALAQVYEKNRGISFDPDEQRQNELYYIMLSGLFIAFSVGSIRRAIIQGKLLSQPHAKKVGFGNVLIGDTLYSRDGYILTTSYLASRYNSKNSSNGNSGGGSFGSFGGGSSGGGGASGGW